MQAKNPKIHVERSFYRSLLALTLPVALQNVISYSVNLMDTLMLGGLGEVALSATSLANQVFFIYTVAIFGVAGGAIVLCSQYWGKKDVDSICRVASLALRISAAAGLLFTLVLFLFPRPVMQIFTAEPAVIEAGASYLRIVSLSYFFYGVTSTFLVVLRSVETVNVSVAIYGVSFAVNVFFNYVFIFGKFGAPRMGVAGVAIATVVSQCLSAFLVVRCLMHEEGDIRLELRELRITLPRLRQILEIGIPSGIQGVAFSLSNVIIQASINGFGETVISGNTAASNIEGFIYVACNAFCQANMAFTSQNYGAGKLERLKPIALCSAACSASVGIVGGMLGYLFGPQLLHIYSNSDAVVAAGMVRITIMFLPYVLCSLMDVIVGSIRGLGYSVTPMIVTLLGACAFRVVWIATVFRVPQFHTPQVIYWSYPISWGLTFLAHLICWVIMLRRLYRREGLMSRHHHLTHEHTV